MSALTLIAALRGPYMGKLSKPLKEAAPRLGQRYHWDCSCGFVYRTGGWEQVRTCEWHGRRWGFVVAGEVRTAGTLGEKEVLL